MRTSTWQRAAAALWPPKHEGFVCSNIGALDEGPRGESDFVDVPISQQVDRAMTAEQAILRVEPLADSARRQRVREQHRDLTELGKSVRSGLAMKVGGDDANPGQYDGGLRRVSGTA